MSAGIDPSHITLSIDSLEDRSVKSSRFSSK